jgi:PKD repeat protein
VPGRWIPKLVALVLSLGAAAVLAAPAGAAPPELTASFTWSPTSPQTNDTVTFTSTSKATGADNAIVSQKWDFNNDGVFDASGAVVHHAFSQPGKYTVKLSVDDTADKTPTKVASNTITVVNRPPVASFTFSPGQPSSGAKVTFTSTSSDADGKIASYAWDLDNDGQFDDGGARTVTRVFATPGHYSVGLRVKDDRGAQTQTSRTVPVGNVAPVASFAMSPGAPLTGDTVTFFSTATDADGPIASLTWDLDGDGAFDDGSGVLVTRRFDDPGTYTVRLRVADADGAVDSATKTFVVLRTDLIVRGQRIPLMNPFPVVRITGTFTRRGVRLRRFSVTAPKGAKITVRCAGKRCPRRSLARVAMSRDPLARSARLVRFRRLERRLLPAGIRVQVFVTKSGLIGKYTRFRIRKAHSPTRADRCLEPGSMHPIRCPAT